MARPLITTFLIANIIAAVSAVAIPNAPPARRDAYVPDSAPPLGYVTPSPGAKPTPVTAQGQLVTTYVPDCICPEADHKHSDVMSVYNWYSTHLPNNKEVITRGDQAVTIQTVSTEYAVQTVTYTKTGVYKVGGESYTVSSVPTEIAYAKKTRWSHAICAAHDYIQWLQKNDQRAGRLAEKLAPGAVAGHMSPSGKTGQVALGLKVTYTHCTDDGCADEHQKWSVGYRTEREEKMLAGVFRGYCDHTGPCELYGVVPGYGNMTVTTQADRVGPCTLSTNVKTAYTATHTLTRTRADGYRHAASRSDIGGATATTSAPAGAGGDFRIRIREVNPSGRLRRRQDTPWYIRIFDNTFYVAVDISEAASFTIANEQLTLSTSADFAFADPGDLSNYGPILIGGDANGPSTAFSVASLGDIIWTNSQFGLGTAGFCLDDDEAINGVYAGTTDVLCEPVQLSAEYIGDGEARSSSGTSTSTAMSTTISTSTTTPALTTTSTTSTEPIITSTTLPTLPTTTPTTTSTTTFTTTTFTTPTTTSSQFIGRAEHHHDSDLSNTNSNIKPGTNEDDDEKELNKGEEQENKVEKEEQEQRGERKAEKEEEGEEAEEGEHGKVELEENENVWGELWHFLHTLGDILERVFVLLCGDI
ncbi:hypothetical protein ABW21_db0209121 [Orbilia brochopaga]|nr:hypothetical protein ABW21_db0209121 [Drechslerella brochopaga]